MTIRIPKRAVSSALSAVVLVACGADPEPSEPAAASAGSEVAQSETLAQSEPAPEPAPPAAAATAELKTVPEVTLTGRAEFTAQPAGVLARVEIDKAKPGKHGIHVHEKGDCSDIAAKSMGTHFAPAAKEHGLPTSPTRHLGDLGNIEVAADGKGTLEIEIPTATLDDGPNSFMGRALVIHEKEDVGTGPAGESGPPIACGVIMAK